MVVGCVMIGHGARYDANSDRDSTMGWRDELCLETMEKTMNGK